MRYAVLKFTIAICHIDFENINKYLYSGHYTCTSGTGTFHT